TPRILLVDDDPLLLRLLVHGLEGAGILTCADSPAAAIRAFRSTPPSHPFEVLVTDRQMPGMDGIALLRMLRHSQPHLRVVLTSGSHESVPSREQNGPDLFLPKPFQRDALRHALARVLALPPSTPHSPRRPSATVVPSTVASPGVPLAICTV
ncbi:MAG: hypothetical protein RLZZ142_1897, partial [Verrucomicrobiota bacterium]